MKGVLEMIIIVEGIDRVGKTTLCHKLSDITGYQIYKYHGDVSYDKIDKCFVDCKDAGKRNKFDF